MIQNYRNDNSSGRNVNFWCLLWSQLDRSKVRLSSATFNSRFTANWVNIGFILKLVAKIFTTRWIAVSNCRHFYDESNANKMRFYPTLKLQRYAVLLDANAVWLVPSFSASMLIIFSSLLLLTMQRRKKKIKNAETTIKNICIMNSGFWWVWCFF